MSVTIPELTPFKCFDATSVYSVEFISGTTTQDFYSFKSTIINIDNSNEEIVIEGNITSLNIEKYENIEDYISNYNENNGGMIYYNNNYYLILHKDCCINGNSYSLQTTFITEESVEYPTSIYAFKCFSDIVITLKEIVYQDGTKIESMNDIAITQPVCTIFYDYEQTDGDSLKYYQFFLYDNNEQLLGSSKKMYSTDISYTIENYNNLQKYILKLYCVSQNDNSKWHEIIINTDYNKESVYADIKLLFDKQNAQNIISFNILQLNGQGEGYQYNDENECVIIEDDGYVNFIDLYQTISKNFLCKLWCQDLSANMPIFKIETTSSDSYIEIFFTGIDFRAYKNSCGLKTLYRNGIIKTENDIETIFVTDASELEGKKIYFAIGYYNGRIEMYAKIIEDEVVV